MHIKKIKVGSLRESKFSNIVSLLRVISVSAMVPLFTLGLLFYQISRWVGRGTSFCSGTGTGLNVYYLICNFGMYELLLVIAELFTWSRIIKQLYKGNFLKAILLFLLFIGYLLLLHRVIFHTKILWIQISPIPRGG